MTIIYHLLVNNNHLNVLKKLFIGKIFKRIKEIDDLHIAKKKKPQFYSLNSRVDLRIRMAIWTNLLLAEYDGRKKNL